MWEIVFIIFCVFLNAILAGIEVAFISLSKILLRHRAKQGDQKALSLLELKEKPERTLSTIQIGITLLASLTAAVGGAAAGINLVPFLHEKWGFAMPLAEILAVVFVVAPITYLTVVIGEITPKALALRNPYFFATLGTPILKSLTTFLYPLVRLCEKSTKALLNILPVKKLKEADREKEYQKLLMGYRRLPKKGREYMLNLTNIEETTVEAILLEWKEVDYVTTNEDLNKIVKRIISSGHTRMPVVDRDQVVGMINTKEVLAFSRGDELDWTKLIRPPVKFNKDASLIYSLNLLQKKRIHLGIVEENNTPIGIITIEDIIEEILGEIYDEDDEGSLGRILKKRKCSPNGVNLT